ncbi:MAG: CoA transferase [Pseudomonadota bacterium]
MDLYRSHEAAGAEQGPQDHRPPLHGLRVLDFSHYLSAATCGLVLADMGASVAKVERSGSGDDFRKLGPELGGAAAAFQWANRNKQGLVLDLKSAPGQTVARELAQTADILIENYSTGVMDRLGLGAQALLDLSPGLIYCSISAYGRTGPYAARPGFDPVVQAESGLISVTGPLGTDGSRVGAPVGDVGTGLLAAIAVLGALAARSRTGRGQHVEVSLFDSAITLTALPIMNYLANGVVPRPTGSTSREAAPVDFFETADGALFIACTSNSLFERLVRQVLQCPALLEDARFASNNARYANREALRTEMEVVLRTRARAEWMPLLLGANVPAGLLNSIPDVLAAEEFTSRGLLSQVPGPQGEPIPSLALPFRFADTPSAVPFRAPLQGEHTQQILGDWLGCSPQRLRELAADGAFGAAISAIP